MTITVLTAEQRAAIPEHVQRWIKVGLSTKPVNRKRATKAVLKCYKLAGLPAPRVEFAQSFFPLPEAHDKVWADVKSSLWLLIKGALRASVNADVKEAVTAYVFYSVEPDLEIRKIIKTVVLDSVPLALREDTRECVSAAVVSGQYDAGICAYWRFYVDVLGVEMSADVRARLDAWCEVVQSCGGVYWGRDVATVVDRPQTFERDKSRDFTGVVYRDLWKATVDDVYIHRYD